MYQIVAARRINYESMMWQVPSLALTAQAFLTTIGLSPGVGRLARVAVGMLAVIITLMTVHTGLRHRRNELADSVWLAKTEQALGWETVHDAPDVRAARLGIPTARFIRFRAYPLWVGGLSAFGVLGLALVIDGLIG
ncbi:hypothetical protein GXW82_34655 [Streptacidiphilus sp. 4-A2]|nr:hypothetical protein [Streptacidiphilus sp. 4-A2]